MNPLIDPKAVTDLRTLGGDAFVGEVVSAFLRQARATFDRLGPAVTAQDRTLIQKSAHMMKSGAANLGAHPFADKCRTIESIAATADMQELAKLVSEAESLFRETADALTQIHKAA